MEIFKDIDNYEGLYQVSNLGNIRSILNNIILKATKNGDGYRFVKLYKNKKPSNFRVHRIIATKFIPNPEGKKYINHKNGVKWDNRIENLEWCTFKENIQHAFDSGLNTPNKGEKCGRSILKQSQVNEIRQLYFNGMRKREISKSGSL